MQLKHLTTKHCINELKELTQLFESFLNGHHSYCFKILFFPDDS